MGIKQQSSKGFSLTEVLVAILLGSIALTAMMQFFLAQANQYYWISGSNSLNADLRVLAKQLEKDVRNSLEFYVCPNLSYALNFTTSGALYPRGGNCLLLVQERGMVQGGKGILYNIETTRSNQGTKFAAYPLKRALVTFNSSNKINETEAALRWLTVGYVKHNPVTGKSDGFYTEGSSTNVAFYMPERKQLPGCRAGLYIGTTLSRKGMLKQLAETRCNFCVYSRNPRFNPNTP